MSTPQERKLVEARKRNGPWLSSFHDPVANLTALTGCVQLADIHGTGEFRLLVADGDKKLKVFKDTGLVSEHALLDVPSSMTVFYSDSSQPPSVAVACGSYIYIYRNLRPYFKFTLPTIDLEAIEIDIWSALRQGQADAVHAVEALKDARDNGINLSARSIDLLQLDHPDAQMAFIETYKMTKLQQLTVVTCMETLCKSLPGNKAVSCLVIGTESKHIIIMNPAGSSILKSIQLPSEPCFIVTVGTYDVEYRIIVGCRDGRIYTIKRAQVMATVIEMDSQPVGLCVIDSNKQILAGGMNKVIHSYHFKGRKSYSLYMPDTITSMSLLKRERTGDMQALLVALKSGEVRLYNKKNLVHTIKLTDVVNALRFGPYGREDGALIMTHKSGALTVKYLQRNAKLDVASEVPGPPKEQDIPLQIPKRTKLYVEQTKREENQAGDMHRVFQRDLCKLRLNAARTYVKTILDGQGPLSTVGGASISIEPLVQGLGPVFKIIVTLRNSGLNALLDLNVTFSYNPKLYHVSDKVLVFSLMPGVSYQFETTVTSITEDGASGEVRVFLLNPTSVLPLVSAIIQMPIAEIAEE